MKIEIKKILFTALAYLFAARLVLASGEGGTNPPGKTSIDLTNPLGTATFSELVKKATNYALMLAGPIVTIMFIWGGFMILTAGADKAKYEKGKAILKNA